MSDAEITARKQRVIGTPFPRGTSGNPAGRPRGSRNRLADAYVTDLMECWEKNGKTALELCATTEPATFVKVVASLMPKDISLSIGLDVASFAKTFDDAVRMLGNTPTAHRRPLPGQPKDIEAIEHDRFSR
jgi:uncharacterized protein DUF5681